MMSADPTSRNYWAKFGLALAVFGCLAVLVFREVIAPDRILFMTDNNIGGNANYARVLAAGAGHSGWEGWPLLGATWQVPFSLCSTLLRTLPLCFYVNWFHGLALCAASVWVALFLISRRCRFLPAVVGSLAVFWMGSNLTLTYAGHDGKYGVLVFASAALFLIEMAASRKRLAWSCLAGGAVGMMFVEQQDVALFIGCFLGAYAVYAILRENARKWRALLLPLTLMALTALLVGGPNVLSGYMTQVKGIVSMSEENPQQKWEFCTQWSLTPEDTLEFIAPGYRGIRSGEPEGPYWGRQGRSVGWEKTGQGFQNFKLESLYVGMIPVGLALFAILLTVAGRRAEARGQKPEVGGQKTEGGGRKAERRGPKSEVRNPQAEGRALRSEARGSGTTTKDLTTDYGLRTSDCGPRASDLGPRTSDNEWSLSKRRGDVIFWGIATLLALLLSYGKFFPLYSLFYMIPGMSSIRNPLKFLHVFQIGLGILAAFGADALLRGLSEHAVKWSRRFGVAVLCVAGVMLMWAVSLAVSRDSLANGFVSTGWSQYAPVMADNMIRAAFHVTVMTLIVGVAVLLLVVWRAACTRKRYLVMTALAFVMVGDVLLLAPDYIKTVSFREVAGGNAVTTFLKANLNQQRAYMLSQDGFYNNWLTVLFPYHQIETFNVSQMPRMPEDYSRWLKTVGKDPLRLWQLSAIGYVLAPDQIWQQIKKDPRFASHFEEVKGFNVFASGAGMGVAEVPGDRPAQHRILRFKDGLPRFKLFHDWEVVSDETVGDQLLNRNFDPQAKVFIAPDTADALPKAFPVSNAAPETVSAQLSAADARVTAVAANSAILMFVNKYGPDWKVTVDGRPAPLLRCNSLCLGVYLEPGRHEVVFYLPTQSGLFRVQMAGLLVCCVAIVWLCIPRRKGREPDSGVGCKGSES